jgi:hypothetical protein
MLQHLLCHFFNLLYACAVAEKLLLRDADYYNYLKQSACLRINGVDDAKRFSSLLVMLLEINHVSVRTLAIIMICYLCQKFHFAGRVGYCSNIWGKPNGIIFYACSCLVAGKHFILCDRQ